MLWIGLTGGIGSGKSTVSTRLAELGGRVLDADRLAREVVEPGTPGLARVVERFGVRVLDGSGGLDRSALGRIVFEDPAARRDLEQITHPLIVERTTRLRDALPEGSIVVHDVPLLVELGYAPRYHLVAVVGAGEQVRLRRLERARGMAREEARSRIRSQADDRARRAVADVWLDNESDLATLLGQVDRLYAERLVPLRDNLRAGRVAPPEELLPPWPGEDVQQRGSRVAARLGHVLGTGAPRHTQDGALVRVRLGPEVRAPGLGDRLAAAGFPAAGSLRHGSADPGRPVQIALG